MLSEEAGRHKPMAGHHMAIEYVHHISLEAKDSLFDVSTVHHGALSTTARTHTASCLRTAMHDGSTVCNSSLKTCASVVDKPRCDMLVVSLVFPLSAGQEPRTQIVRQH